MTKRSADFPKILILMVKHGSGHRRCAQALREGLLNVCPQASVEVADGLSVCASWFRAYYGAYALPLKYWPGLWAWIEGVQHESRATGPSWLYRRGSGGLSRYLQEFSPDIVAATEVGMLELAALSKRMTRGKYFLAGAPTGVDVDRGWVQPEVDLYIAEPRAAAPQFEAAGVPPSKIVPCGMPIDPAFAPVADRHALRARLGLEPAVPLLLVLFGSAGFGNPRRILPELKKISQPLQVVSIAGKNSRLERELRRYSQGQRGFHVYGWVDNMPEWMAASDVLLSKPGSATLIESLNSGLPLLAFDPLPGQERRDSARIVEWQVGTWVREQSDILPTVERLLAHPNELELWRKNALARSCPQAARHAAEAILNCWRSTNSPQAAKINS